MSKQNQPNGVSQALRAAGYVPLPRLWVTKEDYAVIKAMSLKYREEINRIRVSITDADHPELRAYREISRQARDRGASNFSTPEPESEPEPDPDMPDPYEIEWPGMN